MTHMDFTRLTEFLDSLYEKEGIPATDCAVCHDHRVVYWHKTGFSDAARTKPVSENDMYILYSATKVMTMAGALHLMEEGKIALTDEVAKYLPAYENLTVREADGTIRPARTKMRICDAMAMAGGLDYTWDTPAMEKLREKYGREISTLDAVNSYADSPLQFDPGTRFRYSLCHDVVGAVIEVASGMTFGAYLQKVIFDPLGMKDTTFHPTAEQKARLTEQYRFEGGRVRAVPKTNQVMDVSDRYESGGAGLYSTVNDYLSFAACLANGGTADNGYRLLSPETVALMHTDQMTVPGRRADFALLGRTGYSYALGVRTLVDPKAADTAAPAGEFGWDGAACAYCSMETTTGTAIYFGTQVLGWDGAYTVYHPRIRDLVYEGLGYMK